MLAWVLQFFHIMAVMEEFSIKSDVFDGALRPQWQDTYHTKTIGMTQHQKLGLSITSTATTSRRRMSTVGLSPREIVPEASEHDYPALFFHLLSLPVLNSEQKAITKWHRVVSASENCCASCGDFTSRSRLRFGSNIYCGRCINAELGFFSKRMNKRP